MKNGAMQKLIVTGKDERKAAMEMKKMDDVLLNFRALIRKGDEITEEVMKETMKEVYTL
jgi:hypothetical protein